MIINLSPQNPAPLYQQIAEQIKAQVIAGELKAHEPLPSIRQLAKEVTTSVITTKRAYEELEREGYIYTRAGLGSFVSPLDREAQKREALNKLIERLQNVLEEAMSLGVTVEEAMEAFTKALRLMGGK